MKKGLFIILFPILMVSCELFIEPFNPDYLDNLYEEIAWANAPKMTVRVEYENTWGVSNPTRGLISSAMDIRQGYPFLIEFTPDPAYVITTWLAYATSSLPENWLDDNSLLNNARLLGANEIILPNIDSASTGGNFSFIINTTEPVTLIPWCKTEPRVTRTEPRNNPNQIVSRASDIIINFNGSLNISTVKFASSEDEDGIWITAQDLGPGGLITDINSYYSDPEYSTSGGNFTVTMSPINNRPPVNSLITVKIQGIENSFGEPMNGTYTFSWLTPVTAAASGEINSWDASYDFNTNNITVNWNTTGADRVVTYYRINKGSYIQLTSGTASTATISGIPRIDSSRILQGIKTSNVYEYEIFIELYKENIREDFATFRIWNIEGMTVNQTNTVYLNQANFATTEGLAAGGFENYILTEDITLSNWTPPSNFTGKLYGNGRTITINSIVSSTNCGLLGVANNATIRDLHIHYQNISITGTGTTTFGGISAECSGSSSILNSIVSGSVNVDAAMNVGGIVGNMLGGTIKNSYSSVDINYSRTGGNSTNAFRIGGFVGYSTSSTLENCGSSNLIMVTHNSGIGEYKIGGFAGVLQNSVSKCFSTTSIEISITSSTTSDPRHDIGGFVGFATGGNYTVSESYATGSITVISSTPENSNYYVGGFVGYAQFGFENCYATGNISVDRITTGSGAGRITDIGGFAGGVFGTSSVTAIITLCFSTGSFTLMTTGLVTGGSVGGLAGYVNRQSIIANSLALGSYIAGIDQGSWTNIGRIGANVDDPPGGQSVYYYNNHAIESLKLYIFRGVSNYPEETEWWEEDMWPNLKNGGTISIVMLARNFYQNTLGFNSTIWDLGTPVTRNGWPTLRNVGGPQ